MVQKFTDEQIVAAFVANRFSYQKTADALNWSWANLWAQRKQRPELQSKLDAAKTAVLEMSEDRLLDHIKGDDAVVSLRATMFLLERKGGYREQKSVSVDMAVKDDAPLIEAALRRKHQLEPVPEDFDF